jgi:hypothetical protein
MLIIKLKLKNAQNGYNELKIEIFSNSLLIVTKLLHLVILFLLYRANIINYEYISE